MATTEELLRELLATAQEQLRWQRASVLPAVKATIDGALRTTQQRRAYEMCDGTVAGSDIARAVGTAQPTVSRWMHRWRDIGIAYEVEGRRTRHLTSLDALGLAVEIENGAMEEPPAQADSS